MSEKQVAIMKMFTEIKEFLVKNIQGNKKDVALVLSSGGVLTILLRYFGSYVEGVSYAILIMNCCVGFFDKLGVPRRFGAVKEKKRKGGEAA